MHFRRPMGQLLNDALLDTNIRYMIADIMSIILAEVAWKVMGLR